MHRFFLSISYKGTSYHGWQMQPNAHTVQQELNNWLQTLLKHPIETTGCGRTDAGVHARRFALHFDMPHAIDTSQLVYKLNQVLPFDIAVYECYETATNKHARFSALSRMYKYFIHQEKDPFLNDTSLFYPHRLNVKRMNMGCDLLMQYADFTSFSKLHTDVKTNDCSITKAHWYEHQHQLIFTIAADRFLRNMVRAIVGTLLDLGREKIDLEGFKQIIESKNRSNAGTSAPAHGLFFWHVNYEKE